MRALNLAMAALFLLFAAVQFNDTEAMPWIAIYSLASCCCLLIYLPNDLWGLPLLIAVVAGWWGYSLLLSLDGAPIRWSEVFGQIAMTSEMSKITREIGGLGIIAVWMLAQSWHLARRPKELSPVL